MKILLCKDDYGCYYAVDINDREGVRDILGKTLFEDCKQEPTDYSFYDEKEWMEYILGLTDSVKIEIIDIF